MTKKKMNASIFSAVIEQMTNDGSSFNAFHHTNNKYHNTLNSLDKLQQFHRKKVKVKTMMSDKEDVLRCEHDNNNNNNNSMDMKTSTQQCLIDIPKSIMDHNEKQQGISSENSNNECNRKRQRRSIKDLPESRNFVFMSDDYDDSNIFDSLMKKKSSSSRPKRIGYEDLSSILLTLEVKKQKRTRSSIKTKSQESTNTNDSIESVPIKIEPQEQLVITHIEDTRKKPVRITVTPVGPMSFGTSESSQDLDSYVQNIHRSCSTNVSISSLPSSHTKRIRQRKRFSIDENKQSITRPRRTRKKRVNRGARKLLLTDTEIEQRFGKRSSPDMKCEQFDNVQQSRSNCLHKPEHDHSAYKCRLKIRSDENKIFDIELAIYSTVDWYSDRKRILSKIGKALHNLHVNWTKIDIQLNHFDIRLRTSKQSTSMPPSSTTMSSSWFLKSLTENGPLIVHIHDRRCQIKCSCSPSSLTERLNEPFLPVVVNRSPMKPMCNHHRSPLAMLCKNHPSFNSTAPFLYNIHTRFFQDLIYQHGTNTISAVTQCVLDLTLIVSVHSSLSYLQVSSEDYEKNYQDIIDPLQYTNPNYHDVTKLNGFIQSDIFAFYRRIQTNKANIRDPKSMKELIANYFTTTSNMTKVANHRSFIINRTNKRCRTQLLNSSMKQQAQCTPIIELKPILGVPTLMDECEHEEPIRKVTKIISTHTIQTDSQRINTITTQEISPHVIRLSISKSSLPTQSIQLVPFNSSHSTTSFSKTETTPFVSKQINIIKPLSSSISPAIKLANPILISDKFQQRQSLLNR